MVLFTLINVSLDISANITWWVFKNTLYGTYYLISNITYKPPEPTQEELELIQLRHEISQLNRQLYLINNPNIITRTQLKLTHNNSYIEEINETPLIDDEFIIIDNVYDNEQSETVL